MSGSYERINVGYQQKKSCCNRKVICCSVCTLVVVFSLLIAYVSMMAVHEFPPLHASCKIDWTFEMGCDNVNDRIVKQMNEWSTNATCGTGQKCLYHLVNATADEIRGTHETPKAHYIDDLTFSFVSGNGSSCKVHGYSTSRLWYAVLDYGTNYCNLHNLISGSGLENSTGYQENTNPNICTQYSSADCEVY